MKTTKIFWGLGLIFLAVILILDAIGIITPFLSSIGDISLFTIIAGFLLLAFTINRISKGSIAGIFLPLSLIFMLFEKNIAFVCGLEDTNIISNWLLLLCAILLSIGFHILLPSKKGKKNHHPSLKYGDNTSKNIMQHSTVYIDCSSFTSKHISNKMGECTIYFENTEMYTGGGVLEIDNKMGAMIVHVPSSWKINATFENSMGYSDYSKIKKGAADGPLLTISGNNKMGSFTIELV